jgi:hypothetical protein
MNMTGCITLTKKEAAELWAKGVIVLDTSTLGNMYCMADEPKKTLIDIFGVVQNQLWLPAQVVYEYRKNREKLVENSFVAYALPRTTKSQKRKANSQ